MCCHATIPSCALPPVVPTAFGLRPLRRLLCGLVHILPLSHSVSWMAWLLSKGERSSKGACFCRCLKNSLSHETECQVAVHLSVSPLSFCVCVWRGTQMPLHAFKTARGQHKVAELFVFQFVVCGDFSSSSPPVIVSQPMHSFSQRILPPARNLRRVEVTL